MVDVSHRDACGPGLVWATASPQEESVHRGRRDRLVRQLLVRGRDPGGTISDSASTTEECWAGSEDVPCCPGPHHPLTAAASPFAF
ncbi:hypothetical protein NDU88_012354 [Pleurodeles waltl]|uniref:Uncharacterized protein n=1 Tax=Pleurodeles waltl TaxID=8319 RepID=A0AAV7R307_PLEWA|nr:hypothetical protein NDU88_012354 [Pleurodeles waltl]